MVAVSLLAAGCNDNGTAPPDSLRIGQLGTVEVRLEVPLRLGVGSLTQILSWGSAGAWSLQESIEYRGLEGDESFLRSSGDPGQFAANYASLITQVNEVEGLELFIDELSQDLEPACGPTRTRVTFTIRDDAREQLFSWTRCADGSLANLTEVGAGPDPAASRVVVAARLARDATLGERFASVYAGSVPFGTLDRGEDTGANLDAPLALTDQAEWLAFWQDHDPDAPTPKVDFETEMVIVAAVGTRQEAGDSVEVRRILQVDAGTQVELVERVPGDFCTPASRAHEPFHIAVAPRTPPPVRFADIRRVEVPCGM